MLEHYRPRLTRYRAGELHGRSALVERVRLVYDYRAFPHRDPDLPPSCCPRAGLAGRARGLPRSARAAPRPAESYVDEVLAGRNGNSRWFGPVGH